MVRHFYAALIKIEEVDAIVEKAVTSCYHTCEKCGNRGTIRSDIGWHQTLCDDHYIVQKRIPYGGRSKSG
jgi:hypothetical protein